MPELPCFFCGTPVFYIPSRIPKTPSCKTHYYLALSKSNQKVHLKRKTGICTYCGCTFERMPSRMALSRKLFCSLDCRNDYMLLRKKVRRKVLAQLDEFVNDVLRKRREKEKEINVKVA